jgi:hypothetical protein
MATMCPYLQNWRSVSENLEKHMNYGANEDIRLHDGIKSSGRLWLVLEFVYADFVVLNGYFW